MTELIKITEQENGQRVVSARELHQFLGSKRQFTDWVQTRIDKYQFIENQDYKVFHKFVKNLQGGRPTTEYALSIDMAKELCMIENNDKGKQARRYFIECERQLKQNQFGVPTTFREALLLAAKQQEEIESQRKQIEENAPRVLFSQAVETCKKSILIGELAKLICQNGYDIGEKRLFQWLRENKYLCTAGERYNQPTQTAMNAQLFEMKKTVINKPDGTPIVITTTKVTGKGQIYFVNKFLKKSQTPIFNN